MAECMQQAAEKIIQDALIFVNKTAKISSNITEVTVNVNQLNKTKTQIGA